MTASSVLASCHKRNSWDFCARFCPHAASGHAAAPPSSAMNLRLFIQSPRRRGRAKSAGFRGRAPWCVCRLMTNSNLVGCTTGKSAGFSPLRIRTGIDTSLTMGVGPVYSVAHQAPGLRQIREIGNSRALCGGLPAWQAARLEPAAEETSTKLKIMSAPA